MIILIGATTANPYHAINPAIRSRTQIFELEPLTPDLIKQALERALTDEHRGSVPTAFRWTTTRWIISRKGAEETSAPL